MPRRLVTQGMEQRRGLQKARDAGDPADILAGPTASTEASQNDISKAGQDASPTAIQEAISTAGEVASERASNSASGKAIDRASSTASDSARVTAHGTAVRQTGDTTGAARPPRRRGRPRGLARKPLSIRIRAELDARLTDAVTETGQGPQELVETGLELLFAKLDRERARQR